MREKKAATKKKKKTAKTSESARKKAQKKLRLCLYITGSTPQSTKALLNLKRICETYVHGNYELQVIDVYQNPHLAREQQIIAAPTLLKLFPPPLKRLIGDLSNEPKVLLGLSIEPVKAESSVVR